MAQLSEKEQVEVKDKPEKVELSDEEWKKKLSANEYIILRKKGTEAANSGEYNHFSAKNGYFACKGCGNPLYSYKAKFDSDCGWPAFDKCYKDSIKTEMDTSYGMKRIEIMCAKCDGHLGHVFPDNRHKKRSDQRHCVNSVSITYVKQSLDSEPNEDTLSLL